MDADDKAELERAEEISSKANAAYFGWLRHILTLASAVVGILISLHRSKATSLLEYWLFVSTITLLAGGILSGCIALYTEVESYRSLGRALVKRRKDRRAGRLVGPSISGELKKVFGVAQYMCYVLLSLALASLVAYAAVIDFPSEVCPTQ